MATTSRPISELVTGFRDTTGAVVASGLVRFYQPGTLVAQTVYSDAACTSAITPPVTLNAAGQATVYTLEAVRMIVKDSTATTTYYDAIPNLNRHDAVYVTDSNINGGAETTLETVLASLGTSFGAGFQYRESATATARDMVSVIRNIAIQAADYGVTADGSTDDTTALQNGINRVKALGGGRLLLPTGTIKITSAVTIDTAGVSIEGNGRGISIIKNASTSGNAINVTLSSGDSKLFLKGFSITASTTSSGKAINCSVGSFVVLEDVGVGLHRTGIDVSAIIGGDVRHCFVDSTDDNAAAVGIKLGASGQAFNCQVSSGTLNGTGVSLASNDGRATNCYVTNFATGYNLAATRTQAFQCFALSSTTGFSVAGVASCSVVNCAGSGTTTDLSVNGSATLFVEHGNTFTTVSNSGTATALYNRLLSTTTTDATATASITPALATGARVFILNASYGLGGPTVTVNAATGTASIAKGEIIEIILCNNSGGTILSGNFTWNGQYAGVLGTNAITSAANQSGARAWSYRFRWSGTLFTLVSQSAEAAPIIL